MDSPLLWYLNRATGLVLLVLLTMTVVLGVLAASTTSGRAGRGLPRFVPQTLHRHLALFAVTFLGAHVVTAVVDTYVDIRWWQAFLPVGATYQPLWLGLGAVALDVLLVVSVPSAVRTRLSQRAWRAVHLLAFVAWPVSVAHGVGIGTDVTGDRPIGLLVTAACLALVALAAAVRVAALAPQAAEARR
jgi:predicted ferric reductase